MTRHILTTATLIAFLAAGQTSITAGERWNHETLVSAASLPSAADVPVLLIDDHLVALSLTACDRPDFLDVMLQLEPGHRPGSIHLWTGRKNAWGSSVALARPDANLAGLHYALVERLTDQPGGDRLWIGIERPDRRPAIGMLPLA